ncbi:condensin-2 complex subunit D3-L-like isoform X4 [Acropora muricata]|uniref:condensin-2 complex subunit D3-L-like isoform X4 n=1 Tax=Acropora muricata TaxID=159855 RepID=UPI0034E4CAF2
MQSERERRTEDLRSIGQRFVTQSVDISFVSFIDSGDKSPHPGPKLESCIMAANIYIILIQVSGSGAYNIFHPLLFQKDLDVLRLWPCKVEKKRKRRNEATAGGRKAKAGRGKSNDHEDMEAENVAVGGSDDDDDCDNDDDNDYLYGQMSTEEAKASIKVKLLSLMQDAVKLLHSYSLKDSEQVLDHVIQLFVETTRLEVLPLTEMTFDFPGHEISPHPSRSLLLDQIYSVKSIVLVAITLVLIVFVLNFMAMLEPTLEQFSNT